MFFRYKICFIGYLTIKKIHRINVQTSTETQTGTRFLLVMKFTSLFSLHFTCSITGQTGRDSMEYGERQTSQRGRESTVNREGHPITGQRQRESM